jgi:hypothetical protein
MRNALKATQEKYDANFKEVRNDFYAAPQGKSDANFIKEEQLYGSTGKV